MAQSWVCPTLLSVDVIPCVCPTLSSVDALALALRRPHPPCLMVHRVAANAIVCRAACASRAADAFAARAPHGSVRLCRRPRPPRHVGLRTPSLAVGQEGISAERRGA
jgi:hypothetical protein